jgi:hypothetical protein
VGKESSAKICFLNNTKKEINVSLESRRRKGEDRGWEEIRLDNVNDFFFGVRKQEYDESLYCRRI